MGGRPLVWTPRCARHLRRRLCLAVLPRLGANGRVCRGDGHCLGIHDSSAARGRVAAPQHGKGWVMIEGLLVGALTGFVGVGGGFVIVPALMILGGLSMMSAAASSLVIIAVKSAAGFIGYQQILVATGQSLDWAVIACFVVLGR